MSETYLQTLAKVVGSYEEAKKRMYAFSTTTFVGFQAVMIEEISEKFCETKEYGGDKYDNGVITPRPPPVHYSKPSRTDRNRNFHGNYQNNPPSQGNYQNSPPQQGNYQNRPHSKVTSKYTTRSKMEEVVEVMGGQGGRGFGRNDYADRPGYSGPPGGYQGPSLQHQGQVNQAGQGQGYYNPQERRNFSQGPAGDFRPCGPSAPGTYGQPMALGNYGQPPAPTYTGGNQGGPGVKPGYGGENRHGEGPVHGGDNLQGSSGQYPSPSDGQQGNWQGRQ